MEINKLKKNDEVPKRRKRKHSKQFRVVINEDANESLEKIINLVNSDFNCGEITKSDVADWLFTRLDGTLSETDLKRIQESHLDEKKMLQNLLKDSPGTESELPPEIRKAIKEHYGFSAKSKRVS